MATIGLGSMATANFIQGNVKARKEHQAPLRFIDVKLDLDGYRQGTRRWADERTLRIAAWVKVEQPKISISK